MSTNHQVFVFFLNAPTGYCAVTLTDSVQPVVLSQTKTLSMLRRYDKFKTLQEIHVWSKTLSLECFIYALFQYICRQTSLISYTANGITAEEITLQLSHVCKKECPTK